MTFSAVGISQEGESSVSSSTDFTLSLSLPSEFFSFSQDIIFDIEAGVGFIESTVSDSVAELSFDITTVANLYLKDSVRYVSNLSFGEEIPKNDAMVFYYPSTEDTLWSVGKRYGVSQKKLAEDNGGEIRRVMLIER